MRNANLKHIPATLELFFLAAATAREEAGATTSKHDAVGADLPLGVPTPYLPHSNTTTAAAMPVWGTRPQTE